MISAPRPRPGMRCLIRLGLTALSAGIFALSAPSGPWPDLVWLYLVPVQIAINTTGARQGGAYGLFFGFLISAGTYFWGAFGLHLWVNLPVFKAVLYTGLFCLYAGIPYGLYGLVTGWFTARATPLGSISKAALLTVLVAGFPNPFPFNPSHSLYTRPLFIQVLDLGGVPLLLFILNLASLLTTELLLYARRKKSIIAPLITLCLLFGTVTGYGWLRLTQIRSEIKVLPGEKTITIASVQPNIPLYGTNVQTALEKAAALSQELIDKVPEADLVVWPEIPVWFTWDEENEKCRKIISLARSVKRPFLICTGEFQNNGHGYYNMAVMIGRQDTKNQVYRKQRLVPFGEYLPLEESFPGLRALFPGTLEYRAGHEDILFEIAPGVLGIPSICYEVMFPDHIRKFIRKGGNVILNMTDDAWFGKSPASAVLLAAGLYRAVEFRVPMVRTTNSGNGCFIRATGEIVPGSRTPEFQGTATAFPLVVPETGSLYLKWGDTFFWGLALWLVLSSGIKLWRISRPKP